MANLYERRLLNDPVVRRSLPDILTGVVNIDDVTIELDNTDGFFNSLDIRGTTLTLDRFDRADGVSRTELNGQVTEQTLTAERAILTLASQDASILQTLLPKRTVTASIFPNAHSEQGLNQTIPIVFGNGVLIKALYVGDDTAGNQYDYLVAEGTPTISTMFRDTIGGTLATIPASEYTISDSAYAGYRIARFTTRQVKFGGGLHQIYALVNGLSGERNFSRACETLLSNSLWGLGETVEATAFTAVADTLDSVGSLYCDGAIEEQRPALDIINDLLIVRGLRLKKTSAGAWTITMDQLPGVIRASFGHGKNQVWRNVTAFNGYSRTTLPEAITTLVMEYRKDFRTRIFPLQASRSILSIGHEKRISSDFIRDQTTADKVISFLSKRLITGDERLHFIAGQEAADVETGDLIQYDSPDLGLSSETFQVRELSRKLDTVEIFAYRWSDSDYVYTPATLPATPSASTDSDFSRTTPSPVTSLSVASSAVYQISGGTAVRAYVTLQYNVPAEQWAQTLVRYRRSGVSAWETAGVNGETGNSRIHIINELLPGLNYDYRVSRANLLNATLEATTDLSSQTAPGSAALANASIISALRQDFNSVSISSWFIAASTGTTVTLSHGLGKIASPSLVLGRDASTAKPLSVYQTDVSSISNTFALWNHGASDLTISLDLKYW